MPARGHRLIEFKGISVRLPVWLIRLGQSSDLLVVLNAVLPSQADLRLAELARKVSADEPSSKGQPESRPMVVAQRVALANGAALMPVYPVPVSTSDMGTNAMALDEALIDAVLETLSVDGMMS